MQIVKIKQRTKSWLEFRRSHVCASDASIIIGSNPYKTIEKLYDEKIKCYEQPMTSYMQRGIDLEPIALREFEKETGLIMFPSVGVHDEFDWMAASFDGMTIEGDAIVEIKCPGKKDHAIAMQGEIPKHYFPQLQHQIHVSGLDFTYYYSFDGDKGIIIQVNRDQGFIDNLVAKEFEFWQSLATLNSPQTICKTKRNENAACTIPTGVS